MPSLANAWRGSLGALPSTLTVGKLKGKRHLLDGRTLVRSALYRAALVAVPHTPIRVAFDERLLARGKAQKGALIVCDHQRCSILNARVTQPQLWHRPLANTLTETTVLETRG